jgi:hypothetical protein
MPTAEAIAIPAYAYHGKAYTVKDAPNGRVFGKCRFCAFDGDFEGCGQAPDCTPSRRCDGRNVVYAEITQEGQG